MTEVRPYIHYKLLTCYEETLLILVFLLSCVSEDVTPEGLDSVKD